MINRVPIDAGRYKICAFCKYWGDKENKSIEVYSKAENLWYFDYKAKFNCDISGIMTKGSGICNKFESKFKATKDKKGNSQEE